MTSATYAGECIYEDFRIEYHIVNLEYIPNKLIKLEAICYNPNDSFDKEAILKFSTNNFKLGDERIKICLLIIDSILSKTDIPKEKIRKFIVKNGKLFYILKL